MESPSGLIMKLHMSKSNLGYLKVKPETDLAMQNDAIAREATRGSRSLLVMDPAQVRTQWAWASRSRSRA